MSIRSWQATPSHQIELDEKLWPVVTQDDLIKAVVDGAVVLDRAGGCLQVVLQRQPTGRANDYVTVAAVVVWMDRTNAKPQPEDRGLQVVEGDVVTTPVHGGNGEGELSDEMRAAVVAATDAPPLDDEVEVDESAVPEALRG